MADKKECLVSIKAFKIQQFIILFCKMFAFVSFLTQKRKIPEPHMPDEIWIMVLRHLDKIDSLANVLKAGQFFQKITDGPKLFLELYD